MLQVMRSAVVNVVSMSNDSFKQTCGNFIGVAALHRKKKVVSQTPRPCEGKPNERGHSRVKKLNLGARLI